MAFVCGPYCTKLLSSMGAEVIKIEKPSLDDKARSWGPFPQDLSHPEKSGLFLFFYTNKYGNALNIETAAGLKIFKELLKWADVLVENHPRKEMLKLGLSNNRLNKLNPSLVVNSITALRQTGPFKDYKGCDLIISHAGAEPFGNPDEGVNDPDNNPPLTRIVSCDRYNVRFDSSGMYFIRSNSPTNLWNGTAHRSFPAGRKSDKLLQSVKVISKYLDKLWF